ncbi:bi-functional transferase/deacetylase, partial [Streptomyces sp. TRM76130]|nr:bi-functional transferase/deacetylase [Streptomyces sp. TRM76130]
VFVDESGRRGRLYRRIGIAVGLACAVYAVVMVVTLLSGNSDAPWLPVPGKEDGNPAGKVDTTPLPTGTADPSATDSASPQSTPSATGTQEQPPATDTSTTGTAPATGQTETESDPAPTVTDTAPAQDGGATEPDPTDTAT